MNLRKCIGLLAIIFLAIIQSIRAFSYYDPRQVILDFKKSRSLFSDFLVQYKEDLSCLTGHLPNGEIVGFTTSVPDKKQRRAAIFHMTQYAIVPALLEDTTNPTLVLAYYPNSIKPKPDIPDGFGVHMQCTEEILLLERTAK